MSEIKKKNKKQKLNVKYHWGAGASYVDAIQEIFHTENETRLPMRDVCALLYNLTQSTEPPLNVGMFFVALRWTEPALLLWRQAEGL